MSRSRSITSLLWAGVQRAVPVTVVVFVAFAVAKWSGLLLPVRSVGPFRGDLPDVVGWFGMVSLRFDGARKVVLGMTTPEEVILMTAETTD